MDPISFIAPMQPSSNDDVLEYKLQLIGSLTLHAFTTMPMLPWVVAEIKRKSLSRSKDSQSVRPVRLYVSALCICCEPDPGESHQWDPLICSSIFEYKPQSLQKLIHNSQDPSYFACLLKEEDKTPQRSTCYVFRSAAQSKHNHNRNQVAASPHPMLSQESRPPALKNGTAGITPVQPLEAK